MVASFFLFFSLNLLFDTPVTLFVEFVRWMLCTYLARRTMLKMAPMPEHNRTAVDVYAETRIRMAHFFHVG
jgi:hypothetical protein